MYPLSIGSNKTLQLHQGFKELEPKVKNDPVQNMLQLGGMLSKQLMQFKCIMEGV